MKDIGMIKKRHLLALATMVLFSCGEKKEDTTPTETKKQTVVETKTQTSVESNNTSDSYKRSGKTVVKVSGQDALNEYIGSSQLTVVDMYADWCGPCRQLAPVLKNLAMEYGDRVSFVKVDVDRNRRLAQKYRANSIPLVLFFKNGSIVDRMEGFGGRPPLEQKIKTNM